MTPLSQRRCRGSIWRCPLVSTDTNAPATRKRRLSTLRAATGFDTFSGSLAEVTVRLCSTLGRRLSRRQAKLSAAPPTSMFGTTFLTLGGRVADDSA